MKLFGSTESNITNVENGEDVPQLEITGVALFHCNIFDKDYQQYSRVLYTFVPNKSLSQLLNTLLANLIFLKTFNS